MTAAPPTVTPAGRPDGPAPAPGRPDDLLVVVPAAAAAGFRLAGARTVVAADAGQARALVEAELATGSRGVIAVSTQLWTGIAPRVTAAWQTQTAPLVIALPDEAAEPAETRRARVRELLARSVGYEITFTPEGGGA